MVLVGVLLFFLVFFGSFWILLFLFTVVVPSSIKLFLLKKYGPTWMKRLAELED